MDWSPFLVQAGVVLAPRPLPTREGIGDRLRTAAFAELQAERAFNRAAEIYTDAPPSLRDAWKHLAVEETKHMNWLLGRLKEMEIDVQERPVSDSLWQSLSKCKDARSFAHYIADSEERGRRAGQRFHDTLLTIDEKTAKIFGEIAREEQRHIDLAYKHFPLSEIS